MRSRIIKALALTLAATSTIAVSAGFSGAGKSVASTKAAAKQNITLSFLMPSDNSHVGYDYMFAAFKKKTGIKVNLELTANGSDLDNLVKTRVATNDLPDILFYNSGSLLSPLDPAKHFLDLTKQSYMKYMDSSFKKAVTVGGKVYGIPAVEAQVGGVMYNTALYKKLGLSVPKTWKQFISNCKKIKAAGKTAVLGTNKDSWTSQVLILGDFYNVYKAMPSFASKYTANKAHYSDTPAALRGFQKLEETYKGGFINKDEASVSYADGEKMMASGQAGHWMILSQSLADIAAKYPKQAKNLDFFPVPNDKSSINGFTMWEPMSFYLSKSSKHVAALKQWATYMVSPAALTIFAKHEKLYGPFVEKNAVMPNNVLPAVKTMQKYIAAGKVTSALEFNSPVKGPNLMNFCVEVMSGQINAKTAAKQYDADVKQQAQQLNLKGW